MNNSGSILPMSEVDPTEETCFISNNQSEDYSAILNDSAPKSVIENTCSSSIKVVNNGTEEVISKTSEVADIEEKCLGLHLLPSGNENSSISPTEWQCEGAGDGLATVGSDEDVEVRDTFWKVPKSLNELLNDASAIVPFQTFIQSDCKAYDMLLFWFACNGLQKMHSEDVLKFNESAEVIWIKFIRNCKVKVSDEIFESISNNIRSNSSYLLDIFTTAQQEIEVKMQDIFVKFCESDIYLFWLFKQEENCFHSSPDEFSLLARPLATLHEDSEFIPQHDDMVPPKLSSRNLQLTAKSRDMELVNMSTSSIRFPSFNGKHGTPYNMSYTIGPTVSTFDSEVHSINSGAQTDSAHSFTDSSLDGSCKARVNYSSRREHHKMRQSAKMNVEAIGEPLSSVLNKRAPRSRKGENTPLKIREFANNVTKRLEALQKDRDSNDKLKQSLLKVAQNENTSDQLLRCHAETSLPPNLLADKLAEKVLQADMEHSQSILDDHVARIWEPVKTNKLPHMNYFSGSRLPCTAYSLQSSSKSGQRAKDSTAEAERLRSCGKGAFEAYRQNKSASGRLMGLDVNSTISLDSGNVADYHDSSERRIPKSRSVPEDMENDAHIIAMKRNLSVANCGLSMSRSLTCGSKRVMRRAPPETDSGVSVVSDSNFSPVAPYLPSDRISSWLDRSRHHSSCDGKSHSVNECNTPDRSTVKEMRTMHTFARSTSPGTQRHSASRRGECCSSALGKVSYPLHQQKAAATQYSDAVRNLFGSKNASNQYGSDRRKRWSSSSSQCMQMQNPFDEQMSKSLLTRKPCEADDLINDLTLEETHSLIDPIKPLEKTISIVYNFQGDQWPFKTRVATDCVTLRKFKQHLPKKGNYRYFFKKFCEDIDSVVFEEVTDDTEIVPVYEGIIVSQIRKDE